MEVTLAVCRLLDCKAKGDYSGDWVGQSKYAFNVVPHEDKKAEMLLQVIGSLTLDFSNGGEILYLCELIYKFTQFSIKEDYDALIDTALKCNGDLDRFFDLEQLVVRSTTEELWTQWDPESVKKLIDENLSQMNR